MPHSTSAAGARLGSRTGSEQERARSLVEELVAVAQRVGRSGLVVGTSGNISVRDGADLWVSASGTRLGELTETEVLRTPLDPAPATDPPAHPYRGQRGLRASMETPFHRAIYRSRPDVGAVLHFQSPWATVLSCAEEPDLDLNFIPEVPAYVRGVGLVPYRSPGTEELAREIGEAAAVANRRILVLRNHGQIAFGPDLATTLRAAEFFEFAARVAGQGGPLRRFDAETIEALRAYGD